MTYLVYGILHFFFLSYVYGGYENMEKVDKRNKSGEGLSTETPTVRVQQYSL